MEKKLISRNYTQANRTKIEYIVLHYTAGRKSTPGSAMRTRDWFNNPKAQASAHYIVDDGGIVQAVEDKNIAWHCGTKGKYLHPVCRNHNSIGIEICSTFNDVESKINDPYANWTFTEEEVKIASDLTKELMKKYNIDEDHVVRHFDVTGKCCPSPWVKYPDKWEKFLESLQEPPVIEKNLYDTIEECPIWSQESVQYFVENKILNGTGDGLKLNDDLIRFLVVLYKTLKKLELIQ